MERTLSLGIGVAAIVGSVGLLAFGSRQVPYGLNIDPVTYRAGVHGQGAIVEPSFRVLNSYDNNVDILQVIGSCTCSKHVISKHRLEPREKAIISTQWKLTGRGETVSNLKVLYKVDNDPRTYASIIAMQATIEPDIIFEPLQLIFTRGADQTQTVRFRDGRLVNAKLAKATTSLQYFAGRLLAEQNSIEVTFSGTTCPSDITGDELRIETNSPNETIMVIPMRIRDRTTKNQNSPEPLKGEPS